MMNEAPSATSLIIKAIALAISLIFVFWAIHALREPTVARQELPTEPIPAKVLVSPTQDHK